MFLYIHINILYVYIYMYIYMYIYRHVPTILPSAGSMDGYLELYGGTSLRRKSLHPKDHHMTPGIVLL